MDTLGMSNLSIVQRLSLLWLKMHIGRDKQFVHRREVVDSSKCPLSEVPLYIYSYEKVALCKVALGG